MPKEMKAIRQLLIPVKRETRETESKSSDDCWGSILIQTRWRDVARSGSGREEKGSEKRDA